MCKLNRTEFTLANNCKKTLVSIITSEPVIITNKLLSEYDIKIVKIVIAATILKNNTVLSTPYSESAIKWANKYSNKVGFMKDLIGLEIASVGKIQQILHLIMNKK